MKNTFAQQKSADQASDSRIVVMFKFGKWPFKRLVGVNEQDLREIKRRMPLKGPLTEQFVFDVLRRDGCKQQAKQ